MTALAVVMPRRRAAVELTTEQRQLRRVKVVWALLFLNVLSFAGTSSDIIIPVPHKLGQVITQGALVTAVLLALSVNPRVKVRPSLFLGLYSTLALITLMMSVRFIGLGTTYRAFRLVAFLAVLWLLTPWWKRRDLPLLRTQLKFLTGIMVSLYLGLAISPSKALTMNAGSRRLGGALWPMPATQVGHYMAELTGLTILLWLCRALDRRKALMLLVPAVVALLLSHTRTALVAMVVGLLVACLSMFSGSRRVRRALGATAVLV
ncbi:MAG TPA: hypothetical protein VFN61_13895, partial [Acidimicrobiales bacterium]|nr:hypothetical protein [Acidimicrobiales bacterium]